MTLDALAPIFAHLSTVPAGQTTFGFFMVEGWAHGMLDGMRKVGIVSCAEFSPSTICPGCTRACMMDVKLLDLAGQSGPSAYVVCDKIEDYGLIELDHASLRQWCCSRLGLVEFLARELGLRAKEADRTLDRVFFGTSRQLRRTVLLEFGDTAQLVIGNDRHTLADILIWDGGRVTLDWELLHALADRATETHSGGKRFQKSTTKRDNQKIRTETRNRNLQAAVDSFHLEHPKWNKDRLAREVAKLPEFRDVSWQRIMRVTTLRK